MMTHNTRFAYTVITNTLAILCLTLGISWLEPLAVPLWLMPEWRRRRKVSPRFALAGSVLGVAVAVWTFSIAWRLGTVFTRKPEEPWLMTLWVVVWALMLITESVWWWQSRPQNLAKPEGSA